MKKPAYYGLMLVFIIAGFACGVLSSASISQTTPTITVTERATLEGPFKVLKVVDGDTITIDFHGAKKSVRMLYVDTPESVHPDNSKNTEAGRMASAYTKERLAGKRIWLEFEGKTREDHFGRLLAYVYVNYNLELIYSDHSKYYTKYGKSKMYHELFVEAERR